MCGRDEGFEFFTGPSYLLPIHVVGVYVYEGKGTECGEIESIMEIACEVERSLLFTCDNECELIDCCDCWNVLLVGWLYMSLIEGLDMLEHWLAVTLACETDILVGICIFR